MNIAAEHSLLVLVDLQQKLLNVMHRRDELVAKSLMLTNGLKELSVDMIVTEQYPAGLGHSEESLIVAAGGNTPVVEKTAFSCFGEPRFRTELKSKKRRTLVFCGIESHVCVLQTVLDALAEGYECIVAADAVSSRAPEQIELALAAMRQAGAIVLSVESILFMLTKDAKNPCFKAISRLVR